MRKFVLLMVMVLVLLGTAFSYAADVEPYDIAFIVKATDSDFWQYTIVGAKNAEFDLKGLIKVTVYGPPSEADIDEQVAILENVVNTKPDAIVIASSIRCDSVVQRWLRKPGPCGPLYDRHQYHDRNVKY